MRLSLIPKETSKSVRSDDRIENVTKTLIEFLKETKLGDIPDVLSKVKFSLEYLMKISKILLKKHDFEKINAKWKDEINEFTKKKNSTI